MKRLCVATSFIQDGAQFLILKRSQRVRTMRGLWSAVSGTIKDCEEPIDRARIEILQETGMSHTQIRQVAESPMKSIVAPEYGDYQWDVFAFLFAADNPKITLNWENTEYRWVTLDKIRQYDTVPGLEDMLLCLL